MALQRKILDDQKSLFAESAVDDLLTKLGGKNNLTLSEVEKKQQELDERLYALAEKHRTNYKEMGLEAT